ncbi:hypothetical protein GMORB2_5647 [Geosmithia morbida]|uniref:M-phase inducer phosphatase n=1 Tax=Geosmithia morbida TaxID=1094350 RepID=A0A9P5D4V4_9HYPO|nr:uncharacterized protein GMORB2_5647 [Geosmithia morbida]KAF4123931.1 hypothetical protein GMORB2_5647 [Geosmithia morbida]
MEASSPLAAMQPSAPLSLWGSSQDLFRSHPHSHYATSTDNFGNRALRQRLQATDYFSTKDSQTSSPAASLAADLSQNFRIDNEASPHFPTPRRALFTANMMGGMESRGLCTTPPIPSSSPAPTLETMEMSPLPHKVPFSTHFDVMSPTPSSTASSSMDRSDSMMLDSPPPIQRQSLEPSKSMLPDRKIAALRRPSLSRNKGHSTGNVTCRTDDTSSLPAFRFGAISGFSQPSSGLSLHECFESASPPPIRRPHSANSPCAPGPIRCRPQLAGMNPSRISSPAGSHSRRPSNPYLRSRKQFRRSLSMYEHPADIMKPNPQTEEPGSSSPQSVTDTDEAPGPILPHFMPDDPADTIPRISNECLLDLLDGKYSEHFDQKMIIDCRFEYEYEGGHIDGAVNHNDKDLLVSQLFQTPMHGRTLLVFHCEYSAHRAPLMARHVRSEDRTANKDNYPHLTYPEVYILDGGYSGFFSEHRSRCYPPEYVEMSDEKHQRTCEREMGRLKQRKAGFSRAQTFAFGQRSPACEMDSPTAPGRAVPRQLPTSIFGASPIWERSQPTRRMASY